MSPRLSARASLPQSVAGPGYDPQAHGTGIVHIGPGAFHRAHQAACTDTALAAGGGDWRITGVSLRSTGLRAALGPQDGRYTLIARSAERTETRVIAAIDRALSLGPDAAEVRRLLAAPQTRIVTLTVTENGYGLDRSTGGVDPAHPSIAPDLAQPDKPQGVAGLLVRALADRAAAGVAPVTVLSCDNLSENGPLLRDLLCDFARRAVPSTADHIARDVAFPSCMVDRITPAPTEATRAAAEAATGYADAAAVETEAFCQWVIEDRFPTGRPAWEASGVLFVDDVRPYEAMKLRMLNGAHSMLAYAGVLAGKAHVADVMADGDIAALVRRHMAAAARTLAPLPGVDFGDYAAALVSRFENPHLRHATAQIATDGTAKLPQRIFAPAYAAREAGDRLAPFAFAVAMWMRYAMGRQDDGMPYEVQDPQAEAIKAAVAGVSSAETLVARLQGLPGLCPDALRNDPDWGRAVTVKLRALLEMGVVPAVAEEAEATGALRTTF